MQGAACVAFAFSMILSASGPTSSGEQGVTCTEDSNCGSGLRCLSETLPSGDGGCYGIGSVCLLVCTTDADCAAALSLGYVCTMGPCGAAVLACQPSSAPGDGGPEWAEPSYTGPNADASTTDGDSSADATLTSDRHSSAAVLSTDDGSSSADATSTLDGQSEPR